METVAGSRLRIRVEGIVQGVGFRPFVYALANELGLGGFVGNDTAGVFAEVEGERTALDAFVAELRHRAPPLARVDRVRAEPIAPVGERVFTIRPSRDGAGRQVLVPPDTATCTACLAETFDPRDRRYRYPFTNCTACGPRYTLVTDVPYDRPNTTMAAFAMCSDCRREYEDPSDRRFHAQPVCCPVCGPALRLLDAAGRQVSGDPLAEAASWLQDGRILAVKGLGGYHLAVLASHEEAVARLRARKRREAKPFAVMAPDPEAVRELVEVDPTAEATLTGARRPIVLLPRRPEAKLASAVAPDNRDLGVMLPYTPMHHLLAEQVGEPFVLTSGNLSDEPIAYRDDDARERLAGLADGFLTHDRAIHARADDSVVRMFRGREYPIRRSRGYAPAPLTVGVEFRAHVLACGGELKNTFCVAKDRLAFLSPHIGDLENYETLQAFTEGIEHLCRLFGVRPEVVAYDPHPEYLSTKYALERTDLRPVPVWHHHAHIASCLADNDAVGPVIGVAFDGTGLGPDGTLWGGELLLADLRGFERVGHLEPVPLPGGATAIRQPWRMAVAYLHAAYDGDPPGDLAVVERHGERWAQVTALLRSDVNRLLTSSAGRLFDAVAALAGVRDVVLYEGQAAIELEQRVAPDERGAYPMGLAEGPPFQLCGADLVRAAAEDLRAGADASVVAARFHRGLADGIVTACRRLREVSGLGTVALSGGVFQNMTLLRLVVSGLEAQGFRVLVHSRVPANDGGLCLGQAVVAAAGDAPC